MTARNHNDISRPTTLAGDISNSATSFTGTDLTNYPASAFVITLDRDTASEEKVLVGTRTVNSVSGCTRGLGGTSAVAHSTGADLEHTMSAADLQEPNAHINNAALDHHTQYHNTARHAAVSHTTAMVADGAITAPKIAAGVVESLLPTTTPLGWLGFEENNSTQNGIGATQTDITGLSAAVTVGANRKIKITAEISMQADLAETIVFGGIRSGGTVLKERERFLGHQNHGDSVTVTAVVEPSAGSHTYKAIIRRSPSSPANGVIRVIGSDTRHCSILVEDIGAA